MNLSVSYPKHQLLQNFLCIKEKKKSNMLLLSMATKHLQ